MILEAKLYNREHLYKLHFVHVCRRCCTAFKDESDLDRHSKSVTSCHASLDARDYGAGFDEMQKKLLKARTGKREFKGNELEYWKGVYRILFPGVSSIPSPCKIFLRICLKRLKSDLTIGYEGPTVDKTAYDESCARLREQSSVLITDMLRLISDPSREHKDIVMSILALISDHQVKCIPGHGNGGASLGETGAPQVYNPGGEPTYQSPFGMPFFGFTWAQFPQTSAIPQRHHSLSDSGFFPSMSSQVGEDDFSLPASHSEIGYTLPEHRNPRFSVDEQDNRHLVVPPVNTTQTHQDMDLEG